MNDLKVLHDAIKQDRLKIVGKSLHDAELYAELAKAKQNGTIFDTTIEIMYRFGDYTSISRPLEIVNPDGPLVIYSFGEMEELDIVNSPQYYEVLALVQQGGYGYDSFPVLEYKDWPDETTHVLYESNTGAYGICNGKCVIITFDNQSIITSAEISNIDPEPGEPTFEINEGDLDKLIGFMLG